MKTVRVVLAEDHTLVRAGIRALLGGLPDVQVAAEAKDGNEVLELVKNTQPDIVLMDIAMPGLNGLEAAARIAKEFPKVKVIILSMYSNEEYVLQALKNRAAGYLLKDSEITELELAIRSAMQGNIYLSPAISSQVLFDYLARAQGKKEKKQIPAGPFEKLTPRQRQILQLIAEGHTTKEIAAKLNLRLKTVDTHRTKLMERLDIHDVAGLVRYAMRTGIVQ